MPPPSPFSLIWLDRTIRLDKLDSFSVFSAVCLSFFLCHFSALLLPFLFVLNSNIDDEFEFESFNKSCSDCTSMEDLPLPPLCLFCVMLHKWKYWSIARGPPDGGPRQSIVTNKGVGCWHRRVCGAQRTIAHTVGLIVLVSITVVALRRGTWVLQGNILYWLSTITLFNNYNHQVNITLRFVSKGKLPIERSAEGASNSRHNFIIPKFPIKPRLSTLSRVILYPVFLPVVTYEVSMG